MRAVATTALNRSRKRLILGVPRNLIPAIFTLPALLISFYPTLPCVLLGLAWFVGSGCYVRWAIAVDPEYFAIRNLRRRRPRFFDPGKREEGKWFRSQNS
jgi:hypothetical protein